MSEKDVDNFCNPYYICKTKNLTLSTNQYQSRNNVSFVDENSTSNYLRTSDIKKAKAQTLELKHFESWFMTILSVINIIIRYTIVQFPFCMKSLGLIYGSIITCIIALMNIYSVYMIIKVMESTKLK